MAASRCSELLSLPKYARLVDVGLTRATNFASLLTIVSLARSSSRSFSLPDAARAQLGAAAVWQQGRRSPSLRNQREKTSTFALVKRRRGARRGLLNSLKAPHPMEGSLNKESLHTLSRWSERKRERKRRMRCGKAGISVINPGRTRGQTDRRTTRCARRTNEQTSWGPGGGTRTGGGGSSRVPCLQSAATSE